VRLRSQRNRHRHHHRQVRHRLRPQGRHPERRLMPLARKRRVAFESARRGVPVDVKSLL